MILFKIGQKLNSLELFSCFFKIFARIFVSIKSISFKLNTVTMIIPVAVTM